MTDPEKQEDYHASHVTYPVEFPFTLGRIKTGFVQSKSTIQNMAELTRFKD